MRPSLLPLLLLLAAAGCATSGAFRAGESAERLQDCDRAVLDNFRRMGVSLALDAGPRRVGLAVGMNF